MTRDGWYGTQTLLLLFCLSLLPALSGCHERDALARLPAKAEAVAAPASSVPSTPAAEEGKPSLATPLLSGALEPHRRSTLSASVGGPVARVHVKEGELVAAGQALVSQKGETFQLGLRQAEAALEGARVQLDAARIEHERQKALLAARAVPRSQYDAIEARYRGARAGLAAAQVGVELARKATRDAVVRAPYRALVVKRHVSEGDYATSMPPTPLVTLEEVGLLDLRIQVPAGEADRIKVGSRVRVRFTATGKELEAKIARVVGSIDPRTRTFSAIAEIENPRGELRPGLFAEVLADRAPARSEEVAP